MARDQKSQAEPAGAVTDEQIRALRASTAAAGGNAELVEVCDIALGYKPAPFGPGLETRELCRAECERTMADPDDGASDRGPSGLRTQAEVDAFAEAVIDRAIADLRMVRS